jgi:hypothetical protein
LSATLGQSTAGKAPRRCEVRGSRFFVGVVLGMTRCDGQDASGGVLDRPMGPCCLSYSMYGLLSSLRLLCICRICRAKGKSALALHAPFPVLPQPANSHSLARAQKPRSPTVPYCMYCTRHPLHLHLHFHFHLRSLNFVFSSRPQSRQTPCNSLCKQSAPRRQPARADPISLRHPALLAPA